MRPSCVLLVVACATQSPAAVVPDDDAPAREPTPRAGDWCMQGGGCFKTVSECNREWAHLRSVGESPGECIGPPEPAKPIEWCMVLDPDDGELVEVCHPDFDTCNAERTVHREMYVSTTFCESRVVGSEPVAGGRSCCRFCSAGKACGDTCIDASETCHKGPGCAC